jgi:geranylgeranyl diphosphate synthase, type I
MDKIFKKYKKLINKESIKVSQDISKLNLDWSTNVSNSLKETVLAGKGVRGSLILMTLVFFDKKINDSAIKIATVIEYLHTALLIQDDIMDHDDYRRGLKTIHKKYEDLAKKIKAKDTKDFGKSMAICIADISIFYALKVLSELKIKDNDKIDLLKLINYEFSLVGFGQIQDLVFSHGKKVPNENQVLKMYQYKTARYTFSLPFTIGAKLAKQNKKTISDLDKLGLYLGLIYQLTDDALTLDGSLEKVGKAIGNDISENKKTFYHVLLRKKANKKDLKTISNIFGQEKVTKVDINIIKDLIVKYGVDQIIKNKINQYKKRAEEKINNLNIRSKNKKTLFLLIEYLLTRKK